MLTNCSVNIKKWVEIIKLYYTVYTGNRLQSSPISTHLTLLTNVNNKNKTQSVKLLCAKNNTC